MTFYTKKFYSLCLTLFLISIVTFGVFQILPGDPATIILGPDADPLQLEVMKQSLHLDTPILTRYIDWVVNALKGDLGISLRFHMPVGELLLSRIPVTASLAFITLLLTLLIGLPLGLFIVRYETYLGKIISILSQVNIAIPSFWMGILLILLFSITLGLLPSGGYVTFTTNPIAWLESLFLPGLSIALGTSAVLVRYLKTAMLDELPKLYVQTARSKGLSEKIILNKHVFKNALIPTITILGMLVIDILGGSIITENVFNLPGLGNLIIAAINSRDLPLIQGLTLYLGMVVAILNFIVDILYSVIDPRIRVNGRN
nr:ABC transporter permease [uncultured Niameybacter sp.]